MLTGPTTVFGIDPYDENAEVPKHPLGTKGITDDGRIFRYSRAGATALTIGTLQVAADLTANHEDLVFATAGAVGDKSVDITVGATAITANEYDGGYLCIIDGTGEGYTHRITKHGTITVAGGDVIFYINPYLQAATTVASTVCLVRNPYSAVVIAAGGTQTDIPVGVSVRAVTANYYCWLQTGGVTSIWTSGTNAATAGQPITIGEANDGSVSERNAIAEPICGYAPTGVNATAGEFNPYFLTLDQ